MAALSAYDAAAQTFGDVRQLPDTDLSNDCSHTVSQTFIKTAYLAQVLVFILPSPMLSLMQNMDLMHQKVLLMQNMDLMHQ